MHQNLTSDPFLILLNNPKQPLHARIFFKNKIFWDRIIKRLKLTLFFLSSPVSFNGQSYQKRKGSGTSEQSFFRLQNKFRKNPLFVLYY